MIDEKTSALLEGGVGYFWMNGKNPKKTNRKMERGHIRRNGDGIIEVAVLHEEQNGSLLPRERQPMPASITGVTEHGGLLLLTVVGRRATNAFGGSRASVHRYRANTLLSNVDPDGLRSDRLSAVRLLFSGIGSWSGLETLPEKFGTGKSNLLSTYSASFRPSVEQTAHITGSLDVSVSSHWKVSGPHDKRTLFAPTAIVVRAAKPRPVDDFRVCLSWIHALLSFAHSGFVCADGGTAELDYREENVQPGYWDNRFMERPPGALDPLSSRDFPMITLSTIGGVEGLARWIRLCSKHPRAVLPVAEPFLRGGLSSSVRLLEVAAGIEYWVNSHRRTAVWAQGRESKALLLARHVGKDFASWVGDVGRWSDVFWRTYNSLKHEPSFSSNSASTAALAESGALLLAVALFNRVSGNKEPARSLFGKTHNTWQLRDAVRGLL